MDSIHPPCEVQFVVRRETAAGTTSSSSHPQHAPFDSLSDNEEYYDQYDDEGAAEYLSDADQSPLSSPPNSPLRLSPCSDDNDDEDHRGDNLGGAPAKLDLSALQLPAIAAAENSTATNLDNPRVGPRLRLDSPDEDDGFAGLHHRHQGGGSKSGGGTTMNRRVFSSSALDSSQQQHRRFQGSHVALQSAMGSSLSALDRKAAAAAADAAALSFSSRAHVPGARLSQDRARPQQQQRHNYQPSSLRDSNGGSFVLPFEDEIDGAPFTSGSSTLALEGSGRSLVVPAAINEFPSLDEDDDNDAGAAAAAERFEIPAAPTDELPPLGSADLGRSRAVGSPDPADPYTGVPPDYDRPANGERRANNNLPPLRPAPSGTHNSDPEKDAPQIHAEASSQAPPAVANPWMSFNLLRQRVIEAVSPLPPISTIVIEPGPGDEVEDNFQVAPASPAGGDEPPSLSRSAVADSRPQMNVSLDDTSMHPLDERDELQQNAYSMRPHHGSLLQSQSADQRMKRDRAVDAEKKGLPSLAVNGAPTRTAEFVPSEVQSLSFDPPKRREVVAVVTPPHPPLHSSSEIADRKSKTPSVSIRRVAEPAPTESASPVVVSPPVTRNALAPQSSLTIAGRTNVDSRRDSFGDEVKLCDRGTHGGWWLEEELNKREQLRVGGDKKQFSVAERIAALKFKIDSPPSSQPSSPDRPVVGKRPASISAPQRPLASRLEPPGTNLPSDPTSTPDKISIVGVFSPPAMKRINDSHESFANVDRSVGSVSSSARATEAFHDAESFADATELSDCFHDAEPETSTSLIGSIESMVRDIEVSTSRKARSTTTSVNRTPLPPVSLPPKPHVAQTQKADGSVRRLADSFSSPQSQASPTDLGASPFASLSKGLDSAYLMDRDKPVLVKSLDSEIGIPKGDVMVSLLGTDSTWSSNVNEAVWRCRTMRHTCDTKWLQGKADKRPVPGHATSLAGSFEGRSQGASLENVQTTAIDHLKYDEMDDALLHYENLLRWYDDFFARECEQAAKSSRQSDITSAKLVVGQAMHNIGVIKLLKGDHGAALTFFERACLNRASCGRLGHPDHTSSLVKLALCHFALENFTSAQTELEEALAHLRNKKPSMAEYRQHAEVLNNLGCLFYLRGSLDTAVTYFEESLDLQSRIAEQSLYVGSRFSCHNGTLNATITKGNLGLLALATGDPSMGITAFEAALRDQQLLLRDAHPTLLSTFEYLSIANQISGNKEKAVQLLRRMLHMQIDVYGPDNDICVATGEKISNLLNDYADGTSHQNVHSSHTHSAQQSTKFRPFSLMRRRHSKLS